ncbi:MAG TPA: cyclic pyranopterin monophosphate synthase MoaC [Candidatus Eremiobacteraceae bacterium]|nr:cyclic pyranopterin monophosphate synthase MoaC [Candidatus Eremiobacteraceae bacterium]
MRPRKSALTHITRDGSARMVDVDEKPITKRVAVARALVRMSAAARRALKAGSLKKGDALAVARIAGIGAAKRTSELIPLCHSLPLSSVDVEIAFEGRDAVRIECQARCTGKTGVEMEALTGAAVAALTIYDMCKAVDRAITIERLELIEKSGGRSGVFKR